MLRDQELETQLRRAHIRLGDRAHVILGQRERIEVLEDLLEHYRADFEASFNEVTRLRKIIQDNA